MKHQICAFQVNGHLDYMRQMDTILVAAGVPSKEVPGASFALHQTDEILARVPGEQRVTRKHSRTEGSVNCFEDAGEATDVTGDGWDIPDVSDLLDSLSDGLPDTPEDEAAPGGRICS